MEFYWLHCQGPDGGVVLFAVYHTRTQVYDLLDDSGRSERIRKVGSKQMLHKWELIHRVPVERPPFAWGPEQIARLRAQGLDDDAVARQLVNDLYRKSGIEPHHSHVGIVEALLAFVSAEKTPSTPSPPGLSPQAQKILTALQGKPALLAEITEHLKRGSAWTT